MSLMIIHMALFLLLTLGCSYTDTPVKIFLFFLFFDRNRHPKTLPKGPGGLSKLTFLDLKQTLLYEVSSEASCCAR